MAKNLRTFIAEVAEKFPGAMYEIARQVDPKFELTAFVAKFAARGEFPGSSSRMSPTRAFLASST